MTDHKFDINSLRIASPCPISWDDMTGDERSRHCSLCSLSVFNISELSADEVTSLVAKSNGRLCIRMYRRGDGTVMTSDCPTGLRAARKKVAGLAVAAVTAVLGLFSFSFGQRADTGTSPGAPINITRTATPDKTGSLKITLIDQVGAVIAGAGVELIQGKLRRTAVSDSTGEIVFTGLAARTYGLRVMARGFKRRLIEDVEIREYERSEMRVRLEFSNEIVLIGVVAEDSMIDTTSSSVTTVINARKMEMIPHEEL